MVGRRIGMAAAALASVTGLVLLAIGTAAATGRHQPQDASAGQPAGHAAARPGNNGTVKIHDGPDEPSPVTRNQPHVCTFHIHARGFDPAQVLSFEVISWPPTGARSTVLTGKITADPTGTGRAPVQGAYSLPDGHYRLVVDTGNGTPTQDKHKVFWVKCTPATTEDSNGDTPSTPSTPPKTPARVVTGPDHSLPPTPTTPAAQVDAADAAADVAAADVAPPAAQPETTRLASTGLAALQPMIVAGAVSLALGLVLTCLSRRRPASPSRGR